MRVYNFDLETTDLKGDFGRLRVACFGEVKADGSLGQIFTKDILDFRGNNQAQRERQLAKWIWEKMDESDILIGHNVKAFDRNFLNGRFARHELPIAPFRMYLDTYHIARFGLKGLLQSYSQESVAKFFGIKEIKFKPEKDDWADCNAMIPRGVRIIRKRCIMDVKQNNAIFNKLRPYWHVWQNSKTR